MANEKIGRNVSTNLMGMFIQMAIAFTLSPFLVHTLGDERYGIWTIAVAFTGYMSLLDIGLSSAVSRYVSKYSSQQAELDVNSIISTAFVMLFLLGLTIVLVSPFMADFIVSAIKFDESLNNVVHFLIIIVSFDIGIFIVSGVFKGAFKGFQRFDLVNYIQIISAIYKAILWYLFLKSGYGLIAMGVIAITANFFSIVALYILLKKMYSKVSIEFKLVNKETASTVFNYSKFTFIAMLANQIIYYSDAFIIGYFLSAAAVTYYSIPWTLAEYTKKICISISQTYVPAVSVIEATGDMAKVRELYISGTKYMMIVSNLFSMGVLILGGIFISLWMGPKYRELGEAVLIILFINQYFLGPQQISYSILQGLSKQKYYAYMSIVVSVLNLILSIILVKKWGIVGVALGAAIPQIIFNILYVPWLTLKAIGLTKWEYIRKTYVLSIVPTLILFAILLFLVNARIPVNFLELLGLALIGSIFYLGSVYSFMLDANEKKYVLKILRIKKV